MEEDILNGLSSPMDVIAWIVDVLLIALLLAGFVALCLWFYRRFTRGDIATRQTPIEIARERYAKGELNKEQFEQIRKDLA
jgi:putative membrane protein